MKAKEYGRSAVSASALMNNEELSVKLVEFLKVCENVNTSAPAVDSSTLSASLSSTDSL